MATILAMILPTIGSFKEHTHEKIDIDCFDVAARCTHAWHGHGGLWPSLKICQKLLKIALFWHQIGLQTNQYMR
jgi:arginase family enzyme